MALTVAEAKRTKASSMFIHVVDVTFDDKYPEGGEPLAPSQLGLRTIFSVLAEPAGGYVFQYDREAGTLMAFEGDYEAISNGPLVEVGNETDLSTVTTRLVVFGQ